MTEHNAVEHGQMQADIDWIKRALSTGEERFDHIARQLELIMVELNSHAKEESERNAKAIAEAIAPVREAVEDIEKDVTAMKIDIAKGVGIKQAVVWMLTAIGSLGALVWQNKDYLWSIIGKIKGV